MSGKKSQDLPVRLPEALYARLSEFSSRTLAPKAAIVRRALEEFLNRNETQGTYSSTKRGRNKA